MKLYGNLSDRLEAGASYTARFNTLQAFPAKLIVPEKRVFRGHSYDADRYKTPHTDLRTGDRLTVFNSIAKGETLWKGELRFSKDSDAQHPFGMNPHIWRAMHGSRLPAKLTKAGNGETVDGTLADSIDRPHDSSHLFDFLNNSYDSIHGYADGDILEVFSAVSEGGVFWQGEVQTYAKPVMTGRKTYSITDEGILDFDNKVDEYKGNKLISPNEAEMYDYRMRYYPAMLERSEP